VIGQEDIVLVIKQLVSLLLCWDRVSAENASVQQVSAAPTGHASNMSVCLCVLPSDLWQRRAIKDPLVTGDDVWGL
jgi:hypothetical protein